MGISTFAHVITDDEASVLKVTPDTVINGLIHKLCRRPGVPLPGDPPVEPDSDGEEDAGEGDVAGASTVSLLAKLHELLAPPADEGCVAALSALKKFAQPVDEPAVAGGASGAASPEPEPAEEGGPARRSKRKAAEDAGDTAQASKKGVAAPQDAAVAGPLTFPPETAIKRRCDLDKCGALCAYLLSKVSGIRYEDEDDGFLSVLKSEQAGEDVCYGPALLVSAAEVAKLDTALRDNGGVTAEKIDKLFDEPSFPTSLGGVFNVKDTDLEYVKDHTLRFAGLLSHAVELKCGLLLHFW